MNQIDASPTENQGLGIALVLGASLIFALSDATAKLMVASVSPVEVSWIRSIVVAILTVPAVIWRRGAGVFRTAHPVRQIARGLSVWFSSLLFLTGLSYLPLADTSAINFIWPILITVFSIFLLGEKVGIRRALATLIGFVGMLIIIRPGSSAFQVAAFFPLGAAVLWALASVMTRSMTSTEAPETTIVWSALVMLAGTSLALPWFWTMPTPREIGLGVLVGIGSAFGHAMIIFAYGQAKASTLAPFAYVQLVWATLCGYFIFGTIPDRWIITGAAIIAASGLYTLHRERVRRIRT
jgi:drug/metabolite transporter (DMT)-like permease